MHFVPLKYPTHHAHPIDRHSETTARRAFHTAALREKLSGNSGGL
jgi:hypothetical protein